MSEPLRFVHISDTHIGPSKDFQLYDCNTFLNARRIVDAINAMPLPPDFVVHTGDIVASPLIASYDLAAEIFGRLPMPIYFVSGNHDSSQLVRALLMPETVRFSSDEQSILSYAFEVRDTRFIVLDARGPDEIDPHGILSDYQFEFLTFELGNVQNNCAVFIHFPPIPLDSIWLNVSMLLINGDRLHQTLRPFREKVRGVFFGHVHRGMQVFRDGILYSSVASTNGQFLSWPHNEHCQLDLHHPPCYNFVSIVDNSTIVKELSIPK